MGGNALSKPSVRLNRQELDVVIGRFEREIVDPFFTDKEGFLVPIPFYAEKQTFGDLDVLVSCASEDWLGLMEYIKSKYSQYVKNGHVFSFGIDVGAESLFQIDLIYVGSTSKKLHIALTYFGFNDLGNLMGRVFHRAGFKYGHRGLLRVVRDTENSDHIYDEVLVSDEPKDIFEFCGYDYERYLRGFDSKEDIFEYASSTPLFDRDIYLFENRNSKARSRDAKRPIYNEFLSWCAEHQDLNSFVVVDKERYREAMLNIALEKFPAFKLRYENSLRELAVIKTINRKFNGVIVRELTGLSGPDLGKFIREFKQKWSPGDLAELSEEVIASLIEEFHEGEQES